MLGFGRRRRRSRRSQVAAAVTRPSRSWETLEGRVLFSTVTGAEADDGGTPNAPPLTATIEGTNLDEDAEANNGTVHNLPDPNGAVGPNHLVSVVRSTIQFFTKDGSPSFPQRLGKSNFGSIVGSFFEPLFPETDLGQPKVIYDQYDGRFVVTALERTDTAFGDATNSSRILIAVSDDADPNGTWRYQAINSEVNITGTDRFADGPGLAVDDNAVYLTANLLSYGLSNNTFGGSRLWILNKTNLYAGTGNSTVTLHDPSTAAGLPAQAFGLQPAHMFGTTPGTTGTFLVSFANTAAAGANDVLSVIRVTNPTTAPAFANNSVNVGDITSTFTPPDAPQPNDPEGLGPNGATIDTGDGRVYNAVWRNNALYAANTVAATTGADFGTATAHWFKVNATDVAVGLADQGNVGGEEVAAGTRTYFPAVNVDSAGNMGLGFAASAPTVFLGAYYTGRNAGDAAGTTQPAAALAEGTDYYFRPFDFNVNGTVTNSPWGSYSSIAVDPSDNTSLWAYNAYAIEGGTILPGLPGAEDEDGRWGTRWGKFTLAGPNATPSIGSLTDSPDPVTEPAPVTLTAVNVADADDANVTVTFYRESNGVAGLQTVGAADLIVGSDNNATGGYAAAVNTAGLAAGTYTYYARAVDNDNAVSNVVSTTNTVLISLPTVTAVYVDGTTWQMAFRQFLQDNGQGSSTLGFLVPGGPAQTDEIPWSNFNRVHIVFSEDVSVQQNDLAIRGVNLANYDLGPAANFAYSAATRTASWTLATAVSNDKILLDLNGEAATGGVADPSGNALDGEWTNPTEANPPTGGDAYPSGNGTAGGDFRFRMNVLPGDVNRSGASVNSIDLQLIRNRQFTSTTNLGNPPNTYTAFHDVNGTGNINSIDLQLVRNRQFSQLPAGTPALVASAPAASPSSPLSSLFGSTLIRPSRAADDLKSLLA